MTEMLHYNDWELQVALVNWSFTILSRRETAT